MKKLLSPDDVKAAFRWNSTNKRTIEEIFKGALAELFPDNGKQTVVREMWAITENIKKPHFYLYGVKQNNFENTPVMLVYEIEPPPKQVTITEHEFRVAGNDLCVPKDALERLARTLFAEKR